jgi:hypothetical protein
MDAAHGTQFRFAEVDPKPGFPYPIPTAREDVRNLELSMCSPGPTGEPCLSAQTFD